MHLARFVSARSQCASYCGPEELEWLSIIDCCGFTEVHNLDSNYPCFLFFVFQFGFSVMH